MVTKNHKRKIKNGVFSINEQYKNESPKECLHIKKKLRTKCKQIMKNYHNNSNKQLNNEKKIIYTRDRC